MTNNTKKITQKQMKEISPLETEQKRMQYQLRYKAKRDQGWR